MRSDNRRRVNAIAVIDGRTLEIAHVYVRMSMRAAMRHFLGSMRSHLDGRYSDARDALREAVERYQFERVDRVTIGRQ